MLEIMKFTLRFIKHLLLFLFVLFPLQLIGTIVLLPVCLYSGTSRIPRIFRWFDNADLYVGRDTSVYDAVLASGWFNNYTWLAWRNPLNYFGYIVLGVKVDRNIPNSTIGDNTSATSGLYYIEIKINNNVYYEYYYVKDWSSTYCFRFRMGHKLNGSKKNDICQYVATIQPYKSLV